MNAYELNQLASGIKVGDNVRITDRARSYERGWENTWEASMTEMIGSTHTVKQIDGVHGINIQGLGFPYFVLEKVE
jgi:hypothetical protein